jgi:uncharacterized protein
MNFHVMLKPRGPICNLACRYCYYRAKAGLFPDSDFRMSEELLELFTRQYIEAQRDSPELTFGWQGGEPLLMGVDFYARAVALQQRYRPAGMRILNTLQTNGTLLDERWCRFFRAHHFLLGVSLDGPRELHDLYRRDAGDAASFDAVMRGLKRLQRHGVEFNVLTCVHAGNADHPLSVYRFLRDAAGARFIQFIPVVLPDETARPAPLSVTGRQYGHFLKAVFDEWVRRDVGSVFVQSFDAALAAWMGLPPGVCTAAETCGAALAMEHNGDVFACDHFVALPYRLGNLRETSLNDLARSPRQTAFGKAKTTGLPSCCRACQVRFACNGGCPKDRLLRSPEGEEGLNYLCEGYRVFLTHIDRPMGIMADELRAGRPAANVMRALADADRP